MAIAYQDRLLEEIRSSSSILMPVAALTKAWVCGSSPAGIVGSNPTGAWMPVACDFCVLSGGGLCVRLVTSPEESYRVVRV